MHILEDYNFNNVGRDLQNAYDEGYKDGKKYAAEKFSELVKKELITLYLSKRCDEIYKEIMGGVDDE